MTGQAQAEAMARAALSYWGGEVRAPKLINIRENIVFQVWLRDSTVAALRLHRPGYQSRAAIEAELVWTGRLAEAGMRVPEPVRTTQGRLTARVGDRLASCVRWLDGEAVGATGVPLAGTLTEQIAVFEQIGSVVGDLHRLIAILAIDGQQAGLGTGARMGVDRPTVGDDEAFRTERFQPHFISAAGNRPFNPGPEQTLERREQDVLHREGERQHPVEESGDRRQFVLQPAGAAIGNLQPGGRLEGADRTAFDLARYQQKIKLAQRVLGIMRFQIVLRPEHVLPARLALPACDGAERVQPPRDGRDKALLRLHIGGNGPEQRRLRLIGAVGAPKALDGAVGFPPGFEQIMDAKPLVQGAQIGMIRPARAACIGKDQDALLVVHERLGFGKARRGRPVLNGKTDAATFARASDDPTRAARHLGNNLCAKMMEYLI